MSDSPRRWVFWSWAVCRALWLSLPLLLGGLLLFSLAKGSLRNASPAGGVIGAAFLLIALAGARDGWRVLSGAKPKSELAMFSELGAIAGLGGICLMFLLIVAPGFRGLFRKSAEGAIRGGLGELRQAVHVYRQGHDGRSPASLEELVADRRVPVMPVLWRRWSDSGSTHPPTMEVVVLPDAFATDSGKWAYVVSISSPGLTGSVFIDCTHTDTKGSVWAGY